MQAAGTLDTISPKWAGRCVWLRRQFIADGGFCLPQAPIGHRQPRAADVTGLGDDTVNPRQDQRNKKLDRSLNFCRGC